MGHLQVARELIFFQPKRVSLGETMLMYLTSRKPISVSISQTRGKSSDNVAVECYCVK